jgi:hypothetical protein
VAPLETFQIAADGIWTWFTDPRARVVGDQLFTMAVDSAGTCRIHATDLTDATTSSFSLSSTGLEIDDHNNGSINVLSNGKLLAFYGKHNDDYFRYRVSSSAGDISAWSAEQARGTAQGPYSYPNAFQFANAGTSRWFLFYRQGSGGGAAPSLSYRTCDDIETFPATTWSSEVDVYFMTGYTPYWKLAHDGENRLHVVCTNIHPVQGQSSIYHFYIDCDGSGVLHYYQSDGTEITSPPFVASEFTPVYDGSTTKAWISDITIDNNGHPRVLWMKYPGNNGSAIEYWHARWTGSAWTNHKITDDGAGLYSPEVYYHGGMCFDSTNPAAVFLSAPVSGKRQIQEWRTSDSGATWAQHRAITTDSASGQRLRPYSPRDHDARLSVIWFEGTYTTFTSYSTKVMGAG